MGGIGSGRNQRKGTKAYYQEVQKYRRVKKEYNLEAEEYDTILKNQNGVCAICKEWMDNPHVDHCHDTGKVRGLLCGQCNLGLGCFKDKQRVLLAAMDYLDRNINIIERGLSFD